MAEDVTQDNFNVYKGAGGVELSDSLQSRLRDMLAEATAVLGTVGSTGADDVQDLPTPGSGQQHDALLVLLPLLIVLSTFLFLLLLFLICVLLLRRRRGIVLRDSDGPVDMSREELVDGEGGFEGVESRWLESANENVRRTYLRAKEYQLQYPPNSQPTDITLSQFLSIQEKGVSAWSFQPDYETVNSLLVHARTEITFLPDPSSSSCVQSNLPLPKLNEVYYWEVKMFDLPPSTNVAVGLATKPYPPFQLPGMNRYSIAYHSNGDKSHNFPFTAQSFGPALKEGDVLGLGYRPRTGTVFFTRNGRKTEDAFIGLSRWNLFPTIGADGPCSVHVNLGQAGFVFIEANVKKWGLAPSIGTLAPPPAYGSERGSILLDVGGTGTSPSATPTIDSARPRRSHRHRRPRHVPSTSAPVASSPLREAMQPSSSHPAPITPIHEEEFDVERSGTVTPGAGPSSGRRYISPTDMPFHSPPNANLPASPSSPTSPSGDEAHGRAPSFRTNDSGSGSSRSSSASRSRSPAPQASTAAGTSSLFSTPRRPPPPFTRTHVARLSGSGTGPDGLNVQISPESPNSPNPPTPDLRDIHMQSLNSAPQSGNGSRTESRADSSQRREPPAYSPLDSFAYADGVQLDLPSEVIAAALEGNAVPESAVGQGNRSRSNRRSRRR